MVDPQGQVTPMQMPIAKNILTNAQKVSLARLMFYPANDCLYLSVPNLNNEPWIDKLGVFNLRSKAWSIWNYQHSCLGIGISKAIVTIHSLGPSDPQVPNSSHYPGWVTPAPDYHYQNPSSKTTSTQINSQTNAFDFYNGDPTSMDLFAITFSQASATSGDCHLMRYANDYHDFDPASGLTLPINWILETGDMDFDEPNQNKSFLRMSLKEDHDIVQAPVWPVLTPFHTWNVSVSMDKGLTWKGPWPLVIPQAGVEEEVVFRALGDVARFRFATSDHSPRVRVEELVTRVRLRGSEQHRIRV
jgi:hypothetical protein